MRISPFAGIQVISSVACLEETEERLFPESKNRSARIRKKLIKRFGGEFRKRPCIFHDTLNNVLIAHPAMYERIRSAVEISANG